GDRLEVLELQPHVREPRPQFQPDQRCANDRCGDALPSVPDLIQDDGAHRFKGPRHLAPRTSAAAATSSTATPTDLNNVISCALRLPGSAPATTAPISTTSLCAAMTDRKSTRLNSSHQIISYAVFCLKKK